MLSVIYSLCSLLPTFNYFSGLMVLSCMVPMMMSYVYKTSYYIQDILWWSNDFNMLLNFMTIILVALIIIAEMRLWDIQYSQLHLLLGIILLLCFSCESFVGFYIFFESSLLPILFIILGWGYQPERLQAGLYMILYTVLGSMPLMVVILYINFITSVSSMMMLMHMSWSLSQGVFNIGLFAFLVKLPMYVFHLWLPKAHVEAPVGGSMILAGALLKLGGYGLYIYNLTLPHVCGVVMYVIMCLSVWGGLVAGILCFTQSDIKAMIAYSSVVHMSVVVVGVLSSTSMGQISSLITMLAHGWASSALFLLAFVTYEVVGSRSFNYTKGLLSVYPILSFGWFIIAVVNMAAPPTINLIGELLIIPVLSLLNVFLLVVALCVMFLSVGYNMYLYSLVNHGSISGYMGVHQPTSSKWSLCLVAHTMPLLLLLSMDFLSFYTVYCMLVSFLRLTKSLL